MSGDWLLSGGPHRPLSEPVRLADFEGERLAALRALWQKLSETRDRWDDEDLAMFAILDYLFKITTITSSAAAVYAQKVAFESLPKPEKGRRVLPRERRDAIIVTVGAMWEHFTAPNFPLPDPPEA